jgi:hypothetical protein
MSQWRVILRKSNDLSKIGELTQARGRKLDLLLDKPGSGGFNYPMSAQYAELIVPYSTAVSYERYNWRATKAWWAAGNRGRIWDWIWSGYVMPIKEAWHDDMMDVSCAGWANRYSKRFIRRNKLWSLYDDSDIIKDLVQEMNLATTPESTPSTYAIPAGSNPNTLTWMDWGGTLPNEGPGGATAYVSRAATTSQITLSKPRYTKVLPIFDEVSQIENGCDWWVHPKTRLVYCYRKRCTDRPNVVIAFKKGPANLQGFERNLDAEQQANYFVTTGNASATPGAAQDLTSAATIGLLEETASWSDQGDTGMLMKNSGAEIIVRANGKITYSITPFPYVGDVNVLPNSVPEPFVDYDPVGDQVRVSAVHAKRGNISRQVVRSFGINVSIDDDGNENIGSLIVAP